MEHSEYNPFTLTGRPSNHFNSINYAALNKTDGTRKRFVSRFGDNGCLVEIDLTGFHLYLIYMILNKPFPINIYEELGKTYFSKSELSQEEIGQAKIITFRQIYGGVQEEYSKIEPFASISQLAYQTLISYRNGTLKTFLFDRPIVKDSLKDMNANKIFNYMLQNLETEFNFNLIKRFNAITQDTKTKLILYTYDSFLFDFNFGDGKQLLHSIVEILEGIPHHMKVGVNYHEMKPKILK